MDKTFEIMVKLTFRTFGGDVKNATEAMTKRLVNDANNSSVMGNDDEGAEIQLVRVDFYDFGV